MLEHLKPIIETSTIRKYKLGSTVLYQSEVPRSACILSSGVVKVYSISPQGDEQIVRYHVAGEFFPSSWIFGKSPGTLFFYEAVTDCEVAFVPRKDLIDYMLAEPARMHAMLDYFTTNYSAFMIRVNALEQPKAHEKLVYTLFYLCQHYGMGKTTKVSIPFKLTHQDLASLVGLTRETVATEMNKLKNKKVLSYTRQHYIIDSERLLGIIGEDSFKDVNFH